MKELFREQDIIRVIHYKAVLEDHGIPTMIRNESLTVSGFAEIPIPEFFPALCVLDDDDYVEAVQVIRDHLQADREQIEGEIACASCGEINPGNFAICWSCGKPVSGEADAGQGNPMRK